MKLNYLKYIMRHFLSIVLLSASVSLSAADIWVSAEV